MTLPGVKFIMESIFKEFQKCEERGTHSSLHFNLQEPVTEQDFFIGYIASKVITETDLKSKTIWVHLNQQNLHLCGRLVKIGFKIHEGLDNNVHLYKWLQPEKDLVPPYSMFFLGCGGVLIHQNSILLVQQKGGPRKDQWGVPGGLLDRGESIGQGAVREVWEQTGLKTKFQHIIYFRELNKYIYNSCDLYFACYLTLDKQSTKESVEICKRQIQDYCWVNLDNLEEFLKGNKFGGTQKVVIEYIIQLYKNGCKFEITPYQTIEHNILSRGVEKRFIEHKISR